VRGGNLELIFWLNTHMSTESTSAVLAYQSAENWIAFALSDTREARPNVVAEMKNRKYLESGWRKVFKKNNLPAGAAIIAQSRSSRGTSTCDFLKLSIPEHLHISADHLPAGHRRFAPATRAAHVSQFFRSCCSAYSRALFGK
jgi:hypothetical protein